jgi:LuxR family maltose regulon positive regulatory protein
MTRPTPYVEQGTLILWSAEGEQRVVVDTQAWFGWVETAIAFTFASAQGRFTARRERAGSGRGGWYWRAYHHRDGARHRAYLGVAAELSLERLETVARQLAATGMPQQRRGPAETGGAPPLRADDLHLAKHAPASSVLATKLYLPRVRPDLVARLRLHERLDAGLRRALTLVCAPAGFGKSTLIAEWLHQTGRRTSWLALDAGDSDPAVFLRYLVAALQRLASGVGATMLTLLQLSPLPPPETLLTALLNDLATLSEDGILVLDDYHVLEGSSIHEAVSFLIEHLPPTLHLVIATREDPPLPLARLRAHRQVAELRAEQLRFTAGEAAVFLTEVMGLALSPADVAALEARTEGWIVGLQLAALAIQDLDDHAGFIAAFTGSNRFVVDYLADEVLSRQPDHIQTFLLRTSILERMCGSLCDAVLDLTNDQGDNHLSMVDSYSQLLLEQLERANLFVTPLDSERRWYRYHHLFAEVLHERLRRGAAPAAVATLHSRASAWYAQQGAVPEAIQHALAAEAPDVAAQLIEVHAQSLIARGELLSLAGWLRRLPDTTLRTRPRLLLLLAWLLPHTGALADAARYYAEAELLLADNPDPVLRSEFLALQLQPLLYQERTGEVIALGRQVLEYLPAEHFFRSGSGVITGLALIRQSQLVEAEQILSVAVSEAREKQALFFLVAGLARLGMIAAERGNFAQAEQFHAEALAECYGPNGILLPIAGMALVGLGRLRGWQGRLDDAIRTLEESLELCSQLNAAPFFFLDGYTGLADLHLAQGRVPEALHQLALAEDRVRRFANPAFKATIAAHRASIWRAQGNQAFLAWVNDHHPPSEEPLTAVREKEYVTLVRGLIDTNQFSAALPWLDRLAAFAHDTGRIRSEVDILVLRVIASQQQGEARAARTALVRALTLAAPMGYASIFLEEGEPMAALLREVHARGIVPSYVEKLLAAFPNGAMNTSNQGDKEREPSRSHPVSQSPTLPVSLSLVEPLTPRELEVLRLIAAGASNGAIAEALVISIGTAKKHVNNILAKIDVRSRTQAAIWAREQGLLTGQSES